jgi:uncharacterized damage-inducible protein DinB
MEMKDFFRQLFEYSLAHDKKLIALFKEHPEKLNEKSGELFHHILNAHHIWNQRMLGAERRFGVWARHETASLPEIVSENYNDSLSILKTADLEASLSYKDTAGNSYQNTFQDTLFHIVNHGTYHRGQIAMEFRRSDIDPVISDYIFYKRN